MLGASDALLETRIITPLGMVSAISSRKRGLLSRENKQREFENLLGQPGIRMLPTEAQLEGIRQVWKLFRRYEVLA
jgi:hypothetical protein